VGTGDYDAAAVASDVFHRMGTRGQIKESDYRIIYRSAKFPTSSFAYAHDLEPAFRDKMLKCFYDYRFTEEMKKAFDGADRFFPINYKEHWSVVRQVSEAGGEKFNREAYEKETRREEEAKKKK
jgi:phosphonate transport system substrate-binding protein